MKLASVYYFFSCVSFEDQSIIGDISAWQIVITSRIILVHVNHSGSCKSLWLWFPRSTVKRSVKQLFVYLSSYLSSGDNMVTFFSFNNVRKLFVTLVACISVVFAKFFIR